MHKVVGKLPGQLLMVTNIAGLLPSCLFYIMDKSIGHRFLVDTGAEVSVLPPSHSELRHHDEG